MRRLVIAMAALTLALAGPARAEIPEGRGSGVENADDRLDVPFNPEGTYDPAVPRPEMFLGHRIGARFTPHARMVAYCAALAAAGNRVKWRVYGETAEGRPLGGMIITSPANQADLESIRQRLSRLADPEKTSRREAETLAQGLPIAVWLSYGVHGDEASASEAALAVAHELAAGTGPAIDNLLDSLVVIIDPCLNPDGHDRYTSWISGVMGSRPDSNPDAWEHDEPWPGGRFNHHLFDLNRDWAWQTQEETRTRSALYLQWRPQVHVDFHEMGYNSSYFFFPAAEPLNTNMPPQVRYWGEVFGRGNAAAFDEHGWPYYTAEEFDLYYPGYGDSWPTLQGATGMTYEQAGGFRAGLRVLRRDGTTLTLRERVRHHFAASMATLRTARRERYHRLLDYHAFFDGGLHDRLSGPAAYLFPPGPDPGRTAELVNLLIAHGARVERAVEALKVSEPRSYDGEVIRRDFPRGTYLVRMRQPLRALLNTLLEPEAALPETLFYDVTAWSMPLAFGIEAYSTEDEPSGRTVPIERAELPEGGVSGGPARVAWLLPWDGNDAPRLLAQLLQEGVKASFATRAFEVDGRPFERGTIVVPVGSNSDTTGPLIQRLARQDHLMVHAVRTGWTGSGIDLGSDKIIPIRPPRVAVVNGDPVDPTSFGAVWFLLDRQYEIPCTVLPATRLGRADLSAFNVIVFPDDESGRGEGYMSAIDSLTTERIKTWVKGGGTFVGLKGGAAWATEKKSGLTSVRLKPENAEADDDEEPDTTRAFVTVDQAEKEKRLRQIPGAILRVELDPSHPLAYGYGGEARILKTSRLVFEPSRTGQNVGHYPESPRVSGYISQENEDRLARTAFLIVEKLDRGRAVLYNDDPNFRVFWFGLNRLFLNSLFFTSGF